MLQFQAHGIKTGKGVEKCRYSLSHLTNGKTCITIYSNETCCSNFSEEVRDAFKVENDTDLMTDYFESDQFRVYPDHPLFKQVAEGYRKQLAYRSKRSPRYADGYARDLAALDRLAA